MTKIASEYRVKYGFGLTTPPWSPSKPHSGEDWNTPLETPVDVGDVIIGLTGQTGLADGPHLHIQKMVAGKFVDPGGKGLADTIAFPATVTETGENSEVGKYVRLVDANGVRWSYFHQSKVLVPKGIVIHAKGQDMLATKNQVSQLFGAYTGRLPNDADLKRWVGAPLDALVDFLYTLPEAQAYYQRVQAAFKNGLTPDQQAKIEASEKLADAVKELLK